MRCLPSLPVALLFLAGTPALAQSLPYDRGVSDLAYEPAPSGQGFQISGQLHFDSDGAVERDLSCTLTLFANGTIIGSPTELHVVMSRISNCTPAYCDSCRPPSLCFNVVGLVCFCLSFNGSGNVNDQARFVVPAPMLNPGELLIAHLEASPGSLPEIDTSNDTASLVIGPPPCPADFNADGFVNSQDFFDFLNAFFANDPAADFNHDGAINSQDFFDFLAAFFHGCG